MQTTKQIDEAMQNEIKQRARMTEMQDELQ